MKFNWGTGILIFLIFFLLANGVLIVFTSRQGVNLVHKDYYEKGVDHMGQLAIKARSEGLDSLIRTNAGKDFFMVRLDPELAAEVDSGGLLLFRPSDQGFDRSRDLQTGQEILSIARNELIKGRYLLKLHWYTDSLRYEVELPIIIPQK